MKKWEYRIIDSMRIPGGIFRGKKFDEVDKYLNEIGKEGWEIINLDFNDVTGQMDFVGVARRELKTE
ncbi:MAG: DUF4177 domain-containing protein [Candidatus Marinimicrobia bacterium]|nr:DUF4177 domain-containing protein [bacterium]MCG2714968.1 DUF4177 domain-containing protein [Candidatus Neomarinimicrobiota bacterium]